MSETKFTKGPWVSVKRRYDSSFAVETENTGFSICTTVSNEEIDEHNARLIAAAPEMHAMLEKYVELVIDDRAEDFIFEFQDIKALLAEARGEPRPSERTEAAKYKQVCCKACEGDGFYYIPVAWSGDALSERCTHCNGKGYQLARVEL